MPALSDPWAPFVPRRGRQVATAFGVLSLLVFGVLAVLVPRTGFAGWGFVDSLLLFGFGVLITLLMWRLATPRADVSPSGLVVRNVLLTRRLAWTDVAQVRFAGGDPWVVLDLEDGDQLAVMAVQKADGAAARAQASRLVALLEAGRAGRGPSG